ncbi:MAG: prepilin-type N-terminal cleavage/methylation domain-containing protein [bacterium]
MRNKLSSSSSGFTLVEMLVSMTIIALILGLSAAGYNGLRTTQILKQSAETLKSDIMYAKRSAMLIKRNEGENWINGVGIDLASMSMEEGGYRLFKYCGEDTGYVDYSTQYISNVVSLFDIEGGQTPAPPSDYYGDCKTTETSEFTSLPGYLMVDKISDTLQFLVSEYPESLINSVRFLFFESPTGEMHLYDCMGSEIDLTEEGGPLWLVYNLGSRYYQVKLNHNGEVQIGIYDGEETVELLNVCENEIDIFE